MSSDAADLGLLEAAAKLRARELSSRELTDACLERIEERNGGSPSFDGAPDAINAWVRLYPDLAREHAAQADERLASEGDAAPLVCGVPLGLKDLYGMKGLPLTASSRVRRSSSVGRRLSRSYSMRPGNAGSGNWLSSRNTLLASLMRWLVASQFASA